MSIIKFVLAFFLTVVISIPASASQTGIVPSPDTLRKLAYGHEFKTLEAVLEKLQADVLAKRATYAEQRDVYKVLSVLHPDMIKAVDAWRAEMPDSVHARAIRARILFYAGWDMRGFSIIRYTYPEALSEMKRMHTEGMALAQSAFNTRPDIVPVSDAVIWLEQTVPVVPSWIDRLSGDTPFKRIMRLTPNRRTLQGKLSDTEPKWGGSFQQASDLCDTYAPMVKDVEGYTPDICKAEAIYNLDYESEELFIWAQKVLDKTDNPVLDRARWIDAAVISPLREGADERRIKYIPALKFRDIKMAIDFDNLREREGYEKLLEYPPLAPRVYAINHKRAVRELEHDPYNYKLLHVLLTPNIGNNKAEYQLEWPVIEDYNRRLLVLAPFNGEYWKDYAKALAAARDHNRVAGEGIEQRIEEYYQNAVFYSNYSPENLYFYSDYSLVKILTDMPLEGISINGVGGNYRDESSFTPQEIQRQNKYYLCPFIRTGRLLNAVCETGVRSQYCGYVSITKLEIESVFNIASKRGVCEHERYAPIEEILFQPTSYDWQVSPMQQ